jgi:hypothetical protein
MALDKGEWSASRPGRFTPGERAPGTHWIGDCVGLRAGLDAMEKRKSLVPATNQTPTLQSEACHYIDREPPVVLIKYVLFIYLLVSNSWIYDFENLCASRNDCWAFISFCLNI